MKADRSGIVSELIRVSVLETAAEKAVDGSL